MKKGFIRSVLVNMLAAIVNGWTFSVFWPPSSLGCPNEKATSSPRYGARCIGRRDHRCFPAAAPISKEAQPKADVKLLSWHCSSAYGSNSAHIRAFRAATLPPRKRRALDRK